MLIASSTKPLYLQLKESIKNKVVNKELKPGDKLPGERQLIELYSVSRITVRQAIAELVNDGILYSHHGKGTFVASTKIERPLAKLLGYGEELSNDGLETKIAVLRSGFEMPTNEVKEKLRLKDGEKVYAVTRVFSTLDEPLLLDRAYIPPELGNLLATADLSKDLIYHIFELYGIKITRGEQEIRATVCSPKDAKLLNVGSGLEMLSIARLTFAKDDIPVSYSRALYRGDRYVYKVELKR